MGKGRGIVISHPATQARGNFPKFPLPTSPPYPFLESYHGTVSSILAVPFQILKRRLL